MKERERQLAGPETIISRIVTWVLQAHDVNGGTINSNLMCV